MATTAVPGTDRPHQAAKRYIYAWGEGTAEGNGKMKDLLGGKGAGLAEMTIAGLPTPPGFTITTEACNDYFAAGKAAARRACGTTCSRRCARWSGAPARASATRTTRSSSRSARAPSSRCPG